MKNSNISKGELVLINYVFFKIFLFKIISFKLYFLRFSQIFQLLTKFEN